MMNKNYIGVCLIGAGRAGMIHAKNFKNGVPNAKLVAVADPYETACINACQELEVDKYFIDYKKALIHPDVDAVIIASPAVYHRDIAVDAANAGKHILCEKPMAMNEQECHEIIVAVESNKVKLQIAFMRRFDQSFIDAKKAIKDGVIGDVVLVKSLTRGPSKPKEWMYDINKNNGPLAEVNSHDIDTVRWYAESELESVYAIGGNYRCPDAVEQYPDFYDNVVLSGKFQNGVQSVIDGAQYVKYGYDVRVEILGTEGVIYLGETKERAITICNKDKVMSQPYMTSWKNLFSDAYLAEDKHFIECIIEDKEPKVTGHDGMMTVKVVRAGNLSLRENRIVTLQYQD